MAINVLPIHLVNKIAAGEVIERPASIVKELIENSLDAGASRIDVSVEDGGRKLISVTDDGCGMSADDLALAFAPHATSKISSDDDLFAISTMGFRGEALASVAAVSHAHIRSRTADADSGYEFSASGEDTGEVRPCAAAPGTTVTIRDLFFNTPARRKFMRTANTEFGHISEQLARLSLPQPKAAFRLTHNGREVQNLSAVDTTLQRVGDLFGSELAEAMLTIVPGGGGVGVAGLAGRPAAGRSSGKWQYYFLNGRYIRDRLLAHALREAYRGLIDPHRWPVAFVFIEIASSEVDVNVHPTKIEVRFRNSQAVHGAVLAALRETLNRADLAPAAETNVPGVAAEPDDTRRASLREALADFFKSVPPQQPAFSFPEGQKATHQTAPRETPPFGFPVAKPPAEGDIEAPLDVRMAAPAPPSPDLIQIHNTYIAAATDDGLVIVDQHALHERLIYNDLKRRLTQGPLAAQRMLIPETLTVTPAEADTLQNSSELLGRLGIEVAPFGPDTLAVQQFPSLLVERGVAPAEFLREMVDMLAEDETADSERLLEGVLEMMACKAAVKAGEPLGAAEMADLLTRREEADKASACPHGRPTTLKLTIRELEKQFKRT